MGRYIYLKDLIINKINRLGGKINVYKMEEWQSLQLMQLNKKSWN